MVDGRRRIAMLAAAIGACALVAMASQVDVENGTVAAFEGGDRLRTAGGALVSVVALACLALIIWATWPSGGARPTLKRRSWRDAVAFAAIVLLLAVLITFAERPRPRDRAEEEQPPGALELGGDQGEEPDVDERRASPTGTLALAGAAVIGLVLAGAIARRRFRDDLDADGASHDETEAATASTSRASDDDVAVAVRLATESADDREAIRLAYRAADLALRGTPMRRPPTAPPREWTARVRAHPAASADDVRALRELVSRYELARFSDHEVTGDDRRVAIDALHTLAARRLPAPVDVS